MSSKRFKGDEELYTYNKLRGQYKKDNRFGEKRTTQEVQDYITSRGGRTLDDIFGTLSLSAFKKYDSPLMYDKDKNRYKYAINNKFSDKSEIYVLYHKNIDENSRIKKGDVIKLFTGTSTFRVEVISVTENIKRKLSCRIKVSNL